MLSPQEFAAAWGDDLCRFPLDVLRDVEIPETSKRFLQEVGLPLSAEVPLGFHVVPLPIVPASPPVQAAKYPLLSRYPSTRFSLLAYLHYELYRNDEIYYAIEEETGHIYCVGPQVDPNIFMNNSIAQFAEFLLTYREFVTRFRQVESEWRRVQPPFRSLKLKWQEIDPVALADPDNYWVMCYYDIMECF